jgi:hypothetical protein
MDQDAEFMGKTLGKMHQYKIYGSNDGKNWKVIVDKSKPNRRSSRLYRIGNSYKSKIPENGKSKNAYRKIALSGFRVFGKGLEQNPQKFKILSHCELTRKNMAKEEVFG